MPETPTSPTARLKLVQESGLIVTTRDNLSGWIQRIATDMQQLRQSGNISKTTYHYAMVYAASVRLLKE